MSTSSLNRRHFVTLSAAVGASQAIGANDRLNIGLIGTGARMRDHFNGLAPLRATENLAVTAICDVYRPNREAAAARVEKD